MNRREQILNYASDLIQTHGYKGFSYKDLAEKLGIAKASIHHHFPSKELLGIAYCELKILELEEFRERIKSLGTASAKLKAYFDKPKERLATKKMCGINAMQSDSADMSVELKNSVRKITQLDQEIVVEILEKGKESGEFSLPSSPQKTSEVIVSALKGGLQRNLLSNDDCYEHICQTLWHIVSTNDKTSRSF